MNIVSVRILYISFSGFRVSGFSGFRVSGFLGFRVSGFLGFWVFGLRRTGRDAELDKIENKIRLCMQVYMEFKSFPVVGGWWSRK